MRSTVLAVLLTLACCRGQGNDGDLDALINEVFSTKAPAAQSGQRPNLSPNLNPSAGSGDKSCTTEKGQPGECVQYYLCTADNAIITDGVGIIDIRNGQSNPCESYMEVCCLVSEKTVNPITPPPPVEPRPTGCGIRNPDGVGFRIKGDKDNEAQFGEFPWMVAILREEQTTSSAQKLNVYQCGGSLIHPSVVMTAAHCIPKSNAEGVSPKLKVRVGEWDTQTKNEIYPHQDRMVSKFVSHEHYYAGGLFNDIALLFLEKPVEIAENVGVVCLPPQSTTAPQARCVASGWGKDVFGKEGRYQVILKKVEIPIMERGRCQKELRKTRLGNHFELHRTFICAGGEPNKDTCKGDGGSPLVCPMAGDTNRFMQSGIVAWGIGCGENSVPGVYVNVATLREWINDQLTLHNIDMTEYEP